LLLFPQAQVLAQGNDQGLKTWVAPQSFAEALQQSVVMESTPVAVSETEPAAHAGDVPEEQAEHDASDASEEMQETQQEMQQEIQEEAQSGGEADAEQPAGNPIAGAIADQGKAYVSVNGDVFDSLRLRKKDHVGRMSGVAIAIEYHYIEEIGATNEIERTFSAIKVVFVTNGKLVEGYIDAASATLREYEETVAEIGETGVREYGSEAWPLSESHYAPVSDAQTSTPEPKPEPEPEETPEPVPTPQPGEIVDQKGQFYVQLRGAEVYSDTQMTPVSSLGRYDGMALAAVYQDEAADGETEAATVLVVIFKTESGVRSGFVSIADVQLMDYDTAREEILGGVESDDLWPIPMLTEVDERDPGAGSTKETTEPRVVITMSQADEWTVDRPVVELKAEVFNVPAEQIIGYQWKNNAEGEFKAVPGATKSTYTFLAGKETTGCEWIVEVWIR
jgi:hypothetical protein